MSEAGSGQSERFDLVVLRARVDVDSSVRVDIGVRDGVIAEVGVLSPTLSDVVYDASGSGLLVVPGLIDLHAHIAVGLVDPAGTLVCAEPDFVGVTSGVTTLVDAGSLAPQDFGGLGASVGARSLTRVLGFMNVSRNAHRAADSSDFLGPDDLDLPLLLESAAAHPEVCGLKLRLLGAVAQEQGPELVRRAKAASKALDLPLMVHIGDRHTATTPSAAAGLARGLREALSVLEEGDILTHVCSPWPGSIGDSELPLAELERARSRGVIFDAGMGRNHFDLELARRLHAEGLGPQTISTDMNGPGAVHHSLVEDMSKLMAVGYSIAEVIDMATVAPARALGRKGELGSVAVGAKADLTVVEVVEGPFGHSDAKGHRFEGDLALAPRVTIREGNVIQPRQGPHDGAWLATHVATPTLRNS